MKCKMKIKKYKKKFSFRIKNWLEKKSKSVIYFFLFLAGLFIVAISFCVKENWVNIFAGIGTGILTSLIVSIIINEENKAREKRKRDEEKRYLLNNIIKVSLDVYEELLLEINRFILISDLKISLIYGLYDDFNEYYEFEEQIKKINLSTCSVELKNALERLFYFRNYHYEHLIAELKEIPKNEYFLRGILTSQECSNLISNYENEQYIKYALNINEFWSEKIIDIEKCIIFLRMQIYISSKIIACFEYSKQKIKYIEGDIQEIMDQLYFDEIYSQSESYLEDQIALAEEEEQYYINHPKEWEALQKEIVESENETEEDRVLKHLAYCIYGFSQYKGEKLIERLHPDSEAVVKFFKDKKIRKALRKKRKLRKAIIEKFGIQVITE